MKPSRYNLIQYERGFSYWYNTLNRTFFRVSEALGRIIERNLKSEETLRNIPGKLYDKLTEGGFLVEDSLDELKLLRERNEASIHDRNYFLVLLPTLNCNFSCHYCIQDHVPTMMTPETLEKVKRHLEYMVCTEKVKSLRIDFFGGEPFMYFKKVVEPLCRFAIDLCDRNGIPFTASSTTNGYFIDREVSAILPELRFSMFQITLDGDRDIHNRVKFQKGCDSAFDRVLGNIENMMTDNPDMTLYLRLNYDHTNFTDAIVGQVDGIISPEHRKRIVVCPHKVWQERVDREFDIQPLLDRFERSGYNVRRWNPSINFVPCYAGQEFYNAINYNGNVVKCTACDDLYSKEPLGTIMENGAIEWRDGLDRKYIQKTFENDRCLECVCLPLCMGMCPRNFIQGGTGCVREYEDASLEKGAIAEIDASYENLDKESPDDGNDRNSDTSQGKESGNNPEKGPVEESDKL